MERIKRTVEQRIKRGRAIIGFIANVVAYLSVSFLVMTAFGSQGWLNFLVFGWGIGIVWHGGETFYGRDARTRQHQQELARELARHGYDPSMATQIELDMSSDLSTHTYKH